MKKADEIKKLKHELGRYQKKVGDQQKEINELKKQNEAGNVAVAMSEAVIALVLRECGFTLAKPFFTNTEQLGEAVKAGLRPRLQPGEDKAILMWHEE